MADETRPKRRIIENKSPQVREVPVLAVPSVQSLLDDALGVVGSEIVRLKFKTMKAAGDKSAPPGLNATEARMLQGYIRSLVELSKEAREREDEMDLANMTDDELIELVDNLRQKKEREQL